MAEGWGRALSICDRNGRMEAHPVEASDTRRRTFLDTRSIISFHSFHHPPLKWKPWNAGNPGMPGILECRESWNAGNPEIHGTNLTIRKNSTIFHSAAIGRLHQ